jgi:2-octaprenyl-6-methoxyphenol hydroxylase
MAKTADFDVIISGAGMVGGTLALALHSGGFKVALIEAGTLERQLAPHFDGRSFAIAYSAYRQWRALGLANALSPHTQPIEQILVTDGRRPGPASHQPKSVFLRFDSDEIRDRFENEPLGYMLENRHIRLAVHQALDRVGIPVFESMRVAGMGQQTGGAWVQTADGSRMTSRLIVAAEGRQSMLRELAGIQTTGWSYGQAGLVATVKLEQPHQGVAHEFFLPDGPFAILPLPEQRASLVWTEKQSRAQALVSAPAQAALALISRRFGSFLGKIQLETKVLSYPLGLQMAQSQYAERLVLVGDAAHAIHPIAGQGLNLGLKDVAALAQVLVEARRLGEDFGSELVLARYGAWRRFDTAALALSSEIFVRLFSNDNPLLRLVRGAGLSLVNQIGPARRWFMEEAGGATGDLPRLLRSEAL